MSLFAPALSFFSAREAVDTAPGSRQAWTVDQTCEAESEDVAENAESPIEVRDLDFYYGEKQALFDISLSIPRHQVTAFIGPSGCGKSTLLRCFNRMNDRIDGVHIPRGKVVVEGIDVYHPTVDPVILRRQVGMVFQKSNPLPRSIFENVAYGLRLAGPRTSVKLDALVEKSLRRAALWDEVKDRLKESAFSLSGGQQQRLCIARAIAIEPKILLMDEPCSALDPLATARVEDMIRELRKNFTVVIVTHNMQQAQRVSDRTAFFHLGKVMEYDDTERIFNHPAQAQTEAYVTGRYG